MALRGSNEGLQSWLSMHPRDPLAWSMLETTPRFGFAPALSVTAWLVLTVYAIEHQLFPQLQARWALAGPKPSLVAWLW